MTLTNRLSLFSLTALGLVLAGFSLTLYFLARTYLYRQVDDRLESVLNTLTAVAEIKPDGVEWEAAERNLAFDRDTGPGQVHWLVRDGQGRRVDGSSESFFQEFLDAIPLTFPAAKGAEGLGEIHSPPNTVAGWQGQPWRLAERHLAPHLSSLPAGEIGEARKESRDSPNATQRPPPEEEKIYPALVITAGMALQPVQATLRNLALALAGISIGLWLVGLFLGRSLCRRALLPVTRMAIAARGMEGTDLDQRLPSRCLPPEGRSGDELDDLTRAFNGLLDRLQESFERQRRFTGDASHQMRTPLTAMLGQVEVALRRVRSPEEYQRVLSAIQTQGRHLRQIMEMLLFLARADAEAKLPGLQTVDLEPWLAEHLQAWSGHPRAADLRLEAEPAVEQNDEPATPTLHSPEIGEGRVEGRFAVEAQPPLLGQLVDNLLDNACKYSESGTPISLGLRVERGDVCLEVKDRGCGIAPEDLPHIFDSFYRSPKARRLGVDGVGLGLAVAQRIALAFDGTITVQSEPGKGSSFTLRLPEANGGETVSGPGQNSEYRTRNLECRRK